MKLKFFSQYCNILFSKQAWRVWTLNLYNLQYPENQSIYEILRSKSVIRYSTLKIRMVLRGQLFWDKSLPKSRWTSKLFENSYQRPLEGNQSKNNCLVSNFYDKLKSPALFSHLFRTEKSEGNFNLLLKLLTR